MSGRIAFDRLARVRQWSQLFAITGLTQGAIQAIGFASGILIIRYLPTQQYALYTLANSMLGAMAILADGGVASGVMSQGGRVWQDRNQLGSVLSTGFAIRRRFAVYGLLVAIPVFVALLQKHQASWGVSLILVLALVPAFLSALSNSLLEIIPKLHQDVSGLQSIQARSSLIRLLINAGALLVFPFASVSVCAAGIAQIYGNKLLRRKCEQYVSQDQPEDEGIRSEIYRVVKRVLPASIYYTLSCQVIIWLLSIFGTTEAVAEVGALGRLVMVLSVFNMACGILVVPRFARSSADKSQLQNGFLVMQCMLFAVALLVVAYVWMFPDHPLFLLGVRYSNLRTEVVWMAVGGVLSMVNHVNVSISNARAYIPAWYFSPIIGSIGLLVFALSFDVGTTLGILKLNAALWATTCLSSIIVFLFYNARITRST